jgi:hypothetical protein
VIEVIFGLLHFLEQQSFPHPMNTGDVFLDESNVKIKSLFEDQGVGDRNVYLDIPHSLLPPRLQVLCGIGMSQM